MSRPQVIRNDHSIILIGNFNPKIFHPAWFSAQGLVGKKEADEAEIEIIHSDIAIFGIEGLKLQVTGSRFMVQTSQDPFVEVVRDLVIGTFRLLSHTPLAKMGINWDTHFRIESEKKWHDMGHKLAPKRLWDGILDGPGMRVLIMEESKRRDGRKGHVQARIEPSALVRPGLFVGVNDHIETKDPESGSGSEEIMDILKSTWKDSKDRANDIVFSLLERIE